MTRPGETSSMGGFDRDIFGSGLFAPGMFEGELVTDAAALDGLSTDQGNLMRRRPCAVLRPRSAEDIRRLIVACREHGVPVAARGQGHTTFGQALTSGVVVEMSALNRIHRIGDDEAKVDAGVLWRDLAERAFGERRRRLHGLPGYLGLSIGGVLAVGGSSLNAAEGGIVDRVRRLQVVTGAGGIVECSASEHGDLFDAALGGLGQCGIVTRATLDLTAAQEMTRTYLLPYTDRGAFFRDFRRLAEWKEAVALFNAWRRSADGVVWQMMLQVGFDAACPPEDGHVLRGTEMERGGYSAFDMPYLEAAAVMERGILEHQQRGWDGLEKPWFDVWLPDAAIEEFCGELMAGLTDADWCGSGDLLLFAHRRSGFGRPRFRVPAGGEWVWLVDVLNDSLGNGAADFGAKMLARNRRLFERARALGGVRYPIGSLEFTAEDWARHYGETWPEVVRCKRRYDPDGILGAGVGMFGAGMAS